jgi:hypothetical protein
MATPMVNRRAGRMLYALGLGITTVLMAGCHERAIRTQGDPSEGVNSPYAVWDNSIDPERPDQYSKCEEGSIPKQSPNAVAPPPCRH